MNNQLSFTAASAFPLKVVKSVNSAINTDGRIVPYHVQLNPTNVCNLNCSFCSCANRNKADVLSLTLIKETMQKYYELGCRAVTITGGGEPLLHPQINEVLQTIKNIGINIGLVTNGTVLHRLKAFDTLTWIRISSEDTRDFSQSLLHKICVENAQIDWAFSHVVSKEPNIKIIGRIIGFANSYHFTHVRLVADLLNTEQVNMKIVKKRLHEKEIDDRKVIYQARNDATRGAEKCYISLLKPVVGSDKGIYPCCGVQYAGETPSLNLHEQMKMGTIKDIRIIFNEQKYFNGSNCATCYYDNYNKTLEMLLQKTEHKEFL